VRDERNRSPDHDSGGDADSPIPPGRTTDISDNRDDCATAGEVLRQIVGQVEWEGKPHLAVWHGTGTDGTRLLDFQTDPAIDDIEPMMSEAAAAALAGVAVPTGGAAMPDIVWRPSNTQDCGVLTLVLPLAHGTLTLGLYETGLSPRDICHRADRLRAAIPAACSFFELWQERRHFASRMVALETMVRRSDLPMLLLDREGSVQFANREARALSFERDGIAVMGAIDGANSGLGVGGTLRTQNPGDGFRVKGAVEHFCRECGDMSGAQDINLSVERDGRRPAIVTIAPGARLSSGDPSHADVGNAGRGDICVALVTICDPERDWTPALEPVFRHYSLSGSEARLACLLAHGASLCDAAKSLKLREQTARSYLKQIFFKTGTHRQGELVWLLLSSMRRILPPAEIGNRTETTRLGAAPC
ncbi:MAG: hypothetical protein WA948_01170, partial [Pontixanthobacter sp.]